MQRRLAVRGIVVHDGKLLCLRLKPYRHADANTYWCTPGGGLDDGEALVPALEREMLKETGIPAKVGRLLYVQQFTHKNQEQMEFFFHIENAADYLAMDLSKTTHGADEIEEFGFFDPAKTDVLPLFLQTESFKKLDSVATKFFDYLNT